MRRALLAIPLGLVLGGCMTYGDLAYTNPAVYGYRHTYPSSYAYTYPGYGYTYPQYVAPQPAVVAQTPRYYYYGPPATYSYGSISDWDRDGVRDGIDRFPSDPRRW